MTRSSRPGPRPSRRPLTFLIAVLAATVIAACGGSSAPSHPGSPSHHAGKTHSSTTPVRHTITSKAKMHTTTPTQTSGGVSSSKFGPVRATLSAANHTPSVGKPWTITVTAKTPSGKPLTGRVTIEFLFDNQVVGHDSPPTHTLVKGRWQGSLTFPKRSIGIPLNVGAVIRTTSGSARLTWPVKVSK
jgi:hypothetical protein